jgi:hypothetical protein
MSYRIIRVYALVSTTGIMFTSESILMYDTKRSDILAKAYNNCIIPMTHGYYLICM